MSTGRSGTLQAIIDAEVAKAVEAAREEEREKCARMCDSLAFNERDYKNQAGIILRRGAEMCAQMIRRGRLVSREFYYKANGKPRKRTVWE